MFDEQDRQYFYNEFKSNGYEVGSYDDFKKDLNNEEDRNWYYNEAKNMGYDVGTQADFDKMVLEPAPSTSGGGKQVDASATTQSVGQKASTETKPQVAQPAKKQETTDKEPGLIAKVLDMIPTGVQTSNGTYQPSPEIPQPVVKGEEMPVKEEASSSSANAAPVTTPTGVVNNEGLMDAKLANYIEDWKQRPDKQGGYFENMVADLLADGTANNNEEAVKIVQSAVGRYANRSAIDVTNQVVSSLPDDTVQDAEQSIGAQWYSHGVQDKLKQEADSMGISYDDYVAHFLKPAMVQSLVNKYGPNYRSIAEGIATRLYSHDENVQDRLMNQDINEALSSVINKYVNPSVVDEYNKAQEAGSKAFTEGMEGSQYIPANLRLGTALGAQYEANEAKDPAKVLSGLQKKFGNLYRNPEFLNDMSNAAFKVMQRYGLNGGMTGDPKQFKPMINSVLKNELDQLEIKGMMPKGSAEYIMKTGLGNTIVGKITRKAMQTDYQNWLEDMANQQYQPGFWENVASGALTFAGDAWSYWLPGAAGGKLTKSMIAKAEGKLAGDLMAKGMERKVAERAAKVLIGKSKAEALKSGAVHGAVTFGGQSAISKPIDEIYRTGQFDENGKIYNPSVGKVIANTLGEVAKQSVVGAVMQGGTIANMVGKGRGLATNILADVGGKVVDSGIMTGHQMLERMAHDPNFKPTGKDAAESFLESMANLTAIGFPGFVGKYARFKDAREFNKKFDFTDQDIAELKRFGYDGLRDAFEKVGIGEYAVVGENAQRLDGQLTQKYMDLMNDKSVPEVLKAKMMAVVEGKRPSSFSPVVDSIILQPMDNGGKVYLETLNKDGGVIDRKEYSSLDEAQKADKKLEYEKTLGLASVLEGEFHNEFTQEHLDGLYNKAAQKYNMGEKLTDEDKAAVYLHQNAGAIKEIMDKQQKGIILTDEEQKQVNAYRHYYDSALENSSVMREFVNTFEDSHGVARGTLRKALESKDKKYAPLVESYLKELYNSIELKREMKQTMDDLYNTAHGNEQKRIEQGGVEGEKPTAPVEGSAGGQEPPVSEGPSPYQGNTDVSSGQGKGVSTENSDNSSADVITSDAFVMGQNAYKNGDSDALQAIDYNSDLATGRLQRAFADNEKMPDIVAKVYNEGRDMEQFVAQRASSLTPAQKEAISKYVEAMDAKKGAIDALQHADDGYGDALKEQLWPYQTEDGNIVPATLDSGKQVFLKKDNEYGGAFVVVPDEQGLPTIKQVSKASIIEKGTPVPLDEYIEKAVAQQKDARNKQFISQFDGSGLKPNDQVTVAMEEGDANIDMTFAGYSEDGKIVLTDGKDYLPLSKEEFAAWRKNALDNTINEHLDAEDDEREQKAVSQAEADKKQRYANGIVGLSEGQPDYSSKDTDPNVAAEYLQEQFGEDHGQLLNLVNGSRDDIKTQLASKRKAAAEYQNWLDTNADLDPEKAKKVEDELSLVNEQIADLDARFKNWNTIRNSVMTPDEVKAMKEERKAEIERAGIDKSSVLPDVYTGVRIPENSELKDKYPTQEAASGYITSERRRVYKMQEETQREIDGVDKILNQYMDGDMELSAEQLRDLNTTKAELTNRQNALTADAKALKGKAESLNILYIKERAEQNKKNLEALSPKDRRKELVAKALEKKDMKAIKEIYKDASTDVMDLTPQTLEEFVSERLFPHSLNAESLAQELGSFNFKRGIGSKYDTNKYNDLLAKNGEGLTISELAKRVWEDLSSTMESGGGDGLQSMYTDQDIRNTILDMFKTYDSVRDMRNVTLLNRIAAAENELSGEEEWYEQQKEREIYEKQAEIDEYKSYIHDKELSLPSESELDHIYGLEYDRMMEIEDREREYKQYVKSILPELADYDDRSNEEGYGGGSSLGSDSSRRGVDEGNSQGEEVGNGEASSESEIGEGSDSGRKGRQETGSLERGESPAVRGSHLPQEASFGERLKSAIAETETEPTEAQKKAGNYKKGHLSFGGYDYTVETPKGVTRSGKDEHGKPWSVTMHDTYGYILGKIGVDGDHIDMFINDDADLDSFDGNVCVVDQVNPETGEFDEHKVMYGYPDEAAAITAYAKNYSPGWKGLGKVTSVPKATFDKWLESSDRKTKPFREYAMIQHEEAKKAKEEGEMLGFPAIDKEGEPINNHIIELVKWAKEQGLEIDPTSKLNSYADLFVMCKDDFGICTLVPDEGEDINQVVYFPDSAQVIDQLGKLQEEFNAGRDLKHSSNIDSELTEGVTFYDADTAREFKDFVNKKLEKQNKFHNKLNSKTIEVPEDATEENPLGSQLDQTNLPFHRDVKEVKPSEMTEAQKVAYDAVSTMLKKAGIPVKVVSNEDMEKVAEAQDNLNLAMLLNRPEMRFKIKTPEEKQAAENAYNFAKETRPDKWKQYAVVDMSNPNKAPEYFEKQELARKERSYYNKLMWGNYKVFNLDKSFEDNVAGLTGSFPSEFDPYKLDGKGAGVRFLRTYHGSGANFSEFDFDHMGEGAGSQAFGWGGYVTSSKKIGKSYAGVGQQSAQARRSTSEDTPIESAVGAILGQEIYNSTQAKTFEQKKAQAIKNAENSIANFSKTLNESNELGEKEKKFLKKSIEKDKKTLEVLRTLTEEQYKEEYIKQGRAKNLYEVDIPDDNGKNYLGWYAPTTYDIKQKVNDVFKDGYPQSVKDTKQYKDALQEYLDEGETEERFESDMLREFREGIDSAEMFGDFYNTLANNLSDKAASKLLSSLGYTGIKYPAGTIVGGTEEGDTNYVIFNPKDMKIVDHTKFAQGKGVVYGYTDGKEIVLNQEHLNPNTPIHEYQHLWRTAAKNMNPELIEHGDKLIMQTQLFADLKQDPNYNHLTDEQICDEAFARLTGEDGAAILEQMANDAIKENPLDTAKELTIINRLKDWLKKFWYWTLDTFTKWKPEDIKKMTLEDIRNLVLRDLANGVDPRNVKSRMTKEESVEEKIKAVSQQFGVAEADVAMYANAIKNGSTAEAARARANIKRHLLQANEDKISSVKELLKYTKPVNEALKENFGDVDAMIEERKQQMEAQRNAMEAARKRAEEEEAKRQKHLEELSVIPDDQLDKQYMDALAKGDDATAREMLDEAARRKGYDDTESAYQGVGAWAAPGNPGYESDKARRDDWESSGSDVNLEDMALGYTPQPDDYFSHPERYSQNTPHGLESVKAINEAIDAIKNGEKDVKVKVYRAVPTSVKEGKLRNGDWVTPSKKYAEMHGTNRLEGKYRIIEDEVPANQLWWDGNDANEFGFDDGKEYKYKNAKNNRKLNDLVTYDDKGDVISPSKRFNSRKSDVRFMFAGEKGAAEADKADEQTIRMDNLDVAKQMEKAKKDAKIIKMATGWEKGVDGKWRYEMPDAKIKDTIDVGGGNIVKRFEEDMLWTDGKLADVIDAPGLLEAYPQLKDVRIDTDAIMNDMPSNGEYNPQTKTITIHADELKYLNSILNHEIQHVIQREEGFAHGGTPEQVERDFNAAKAEWKARSYAFELEEKAKEMGGEYNQSEVEKALIQEYKDMDMPEFIPDKETRIKGFNYFARGYADRSMDDAIKRFRLDRFQRTDFDSYQEYRKLAGEVEARNVEKRLGMTDEERRNSLASETEDVNRDEQIVMNGNDASYSIVKDPETIKKLDKEDTVKVYRAMQVGDDGKLYPPMAAKVKGKFVEPIELGKWEQADERPELADDKGMFTLNKGNGKSLKAAYNPYLHTSRTPLNDQFSEAQNRPNIVTVEVEVPKSELTSGYKADKAKDAVGEVEWKAGIIQGQLTGKRKVVLSRWDKPVRIVPDSEVADVVVNDMFKGKNITMPSNVVTPSLRKELEKRGVPFVETDNRGRIVGGENDGVHYSKVYGKKTNVKARIGSATIGLKAAKDKVVELFNKAKSGEFNGKPQSIGTLTQEGKKFLEDLSGLKMKDKIDFVLNPSDLKHMNKDHFGDNEKDPGRNIPLTEEDLRSMVDVIMNPEQVVYGIEKMDNRKAFFFLKQAEDGTLNLAEIYSDKKGNLTAKSYYKTKKGVDQRVMEIKNSLLPTPEASSGSPLSDGKGINFFSIEQEKTAETAENERKIADSVVNTANKLGGAEATVYSSLDDVPEEYRSEVEQGAKGWYDPETHSVHVYLPNCEDGNEAQRTVFHEKIGHEGMEVLLGGEDGVRKFANFVYRSVGKDVRGKIIDFANKYDPDWKNPDRMNVGTQEYIARLAEEGPKSAEDFTLWTKIKHYLIKVLKKLGVRVPGLLNDKDLRYYLMKAGKALHVWDDMPQEKQEAMMKQASNAEIKDALSDGAGKGKPRQKKGESTIQYIKRVQEWRKWKNAREDKENPEPPMFYDFDKDEAGKKEWAQLNKDWRERHHLVGEEPTGMPIRMENEEDDAYMNRIHEYEKWQAAMKDQEDPMPDMFAYEKKKQEEVKRKYEDWLVKHDLLEQQQADLDLYEGKIYPAETNPKADALEQQVMQDLAEVTSTDVSKEGAAKTVKHAVIHRRKNMEEASADDAIYINDVKNRIEKMADSGAFDKLLSDYKGKPNKAEKLAEAIPYIIEAPRRLRDLAHDLNATDAFDKGHIHIQPTDVEAIQPFVADLIAETGKKHTELKDDKEVEVYDDPQAVSEVASKIAQAINANHQGEEGFVPIDGTDILSEHVLPLVKQQIVPKGIDYKNLSPEMKSTIDSIRDWYNYTYDWLKDNRTLKEDTGYNVDYVNHIWDKEKSNKQAYALYVENRQRTKSPNEKPRTISTLMEGISVGLVPKTTDITKMMAYYSRSNIEAWVNKTMLQELSGLNVIERNEDGEIVSSDALLSSTPPFNLEQYKYFEIPGVGPVWVYNVSPKQVKVKNPITGKEKVLYSEASAGDRFGVVFDTYQSSPFWKAFDTLASSAKKLELGFSGFHAGALTEVYMVQNMVEFGPKKAMANFMKYIFVDTMKNHQLPCFANPEDFQEAATHLVKFGATNDYAAADVQNMFDNMRDAMMKVQEKLKDGNKISGTVALATMPLKVATQMLSLINKGMDRALWDFLHDGLKLATYRMRADKTKERAKKKGWTEEELSRALDEDGQFVNDMFGGQHWDILGASHRTLRYAGRVLLSPDWNASTTRHFLALTGYGSIWNEATFENFKQYYQRLKHKELIPEDEGRRSRQISALLCYGIGFMVFYEGIANGINAAFRALDEEKERKKAEEIRKTNPSYKSMYELAYPDGMKWYDYLMRGNSLGQQSKIFLGRYADGTGMYIRHGKQFREVPEYLFNHKGELEFPGPMVQRMIGKANPMVRMILDDINYLSDFQASHADQEIQRKYGKTIGLLYKDALYWAPFLIPSQENKEFKAVDFFFPSSKGFSPWKAQSYFKDFILSGDMEGVVMTYQSCQRNGIDPEAQIKAAIGSVKALESTEMQDGVTSLQEAIKRFDAAKSITEKKKMRQKMKKFLSQSEYKAFTQKEALDMVQGYLNGDDDLKEMEKAESKYLMAAKAEDVTEDWRIQNVWNGTMETYQEYQRLKDVDKAKANAFKNSKTNKRLFAARKAISAARRKMNKAKKQMDGTNDAAKLVEIRNTRKELLKTLNGME